MMCGTNGVCSAGGACVGCNAPADCPGTDDFCKTRKCESNVCGFNYTGSGTALPGNQQTAGDCKRKVCDGAGGTQDQNDNSDVSDDGNGCTLDGCNNGTPTHVPQTGMMCGNNGVCSAGGTCVACNVPADCPGTDDFCKTRKCESNVCGFTYTGSGIALPDNQQTAGDCRTKVCDGAGAVREDAASSDIVADTNDCTKDLCNGTTPTHPPEAPGTTCSSGGGHKCDGAGACVQCLAPADCGDPANYPCATATCSVSHQCGTQNAAPDTLCGTGPSCSNGTAHLQDKCNGSGTCVSGANPTCAPFVCNGTVCGTSCSDNNGCAAGNECDTGLASCFPTGTPKCTDYCATIMAACTGANQQYPTTAECLRSCAGLPRTDAVLTNTVSCRLAHAGFANTPPPSNADAHCPHAGPAGDGVCGANCESFCSLAATTCTGGNQQYATIPNCLAACGSFSMVPARYTLPGGAAGGDTFACRMYHLTLATIDPVNHCPHIAVISATCHP
jgi:hypothetical protein